MGTADGPPGIVLDMDLSVSPTHGEQEISVWNGHFACTCYHPLFVFNQFGDLEGCALRAGNLHSAGRLGRRAQARRGALREQGLTHLYSSGRGLCNVLRLRVSGSRADQIRDPECPNARENGQIRPSTKRSGYPKVLVAVSTSRLSCKRAGKTRTSMPVWDSSGEFGGTLEVHRSLLNMALHEKPEIKTRDEAISAE